MVKRTKKYEHAFWERNMWNHRIKILQEDYTVKYGKIGVLKRLKKQKNLTRNIRLNSIRK